MRRSARRGVAAVALTALSLLCACAAGPRLESVTTPAAPEVTLTGDGIRWTVLLNAWSAYPSDLWRYFTPVRVRIENGRSDDLQIRYEDFVALDAANQQYRGVPPGEVARAVSGGLRPPDPSEQPRPRLVAGPWYYPYWRRRWEPYYGPWYPDPYFYPYGWPRPAAQDVLTLGLREGRLLAGASAEGFVYLQYATARGGVLTVSWTPHLADGARLSTRSARFRVVR